MNISSTLRKTFSLYSAQIVNLFLGWVVAKLNVSYLSVSEYGQYNFFITAIHTVAVFFTFGIFESASRRMALAKDRKSYHDILGATLLFGIASYIMFSIFFGLGHFFFDDVFEVHISALIRRFFPIAGFYLFFELFQKNFRGAGKINRLALLIASPRIFYLAFLVLLIGISQFTLNNTIFSYLLSMILLFIIFIVAEKPSFSNYKQAVAQLYLEIRNFGIHIYWSDIVNTFLYHLDKLFIAYFLDSEQLAYYALAFTVTLPLSLFSTSLATSLYRRFSGEKRISRRVMVLNIVWILISITALILLRKWIVMDLFSSKYAASLAVVPVLALGFGIGGFGKLYVFYLTAQGQGKTIRNISSAVVITNLALNWLLIPMIGIMGAAIARLISYLLDLILLVLFYRRYTREGFGKSFNES